MRLVVDLFPSVRDGGSVHLLSRPPPIRRCNPHPTPKAHSALLFDREAYIPCCGKTICTEQRAPAAER